VTAECGTDGNACGFVVLAGRPPIHVEGDEAPLTCLAEAIAGALDPPYRAAGIRREGGTWAVGAIGIEVVELPADTEGDELMLTVTQEGERALEVDGRPAAAPIPEFEAAAGGRFDAYVLRATRLHGRLWEIGIDPL
jgi:hypothetical protein